MVAPIMMLGITIILSVFIDLLENFEIYNELYGFLSDIIGYSIVTNLVMLFYGKVHKYCISNIIALWTLLSLNIINIIYNILRLTIGLEYNVYWNIFNYIVMGVGLILIIIFPYDFKKKVK